MCLSEDNQLGDCPCERLLCTLSDLFSCLYLFIWGERGASGDFFPINSSTSTTVVIVQALFKQPHCWDFMDVASFSHLKTILPQMPWSSSSHNLLLHQWCPWVLGTGVVLWVYYYGWVHHRRFLLCICSVMALRTGLCTLLKRILWCRVIATVTSEYKDVYVFRILDSIFRRCC